MSTKTTFKRIALVAVASLGFGMLSVVPSDAATLTSATWGNGTLPTAATAGTAVVIPVTFASVAGSTMAAGSTYTMKMNVSSWPTNSAITAATIPVTCEVATSALTAATYSVAAVVGTANAVTTSGGITTTSLAVSSAQTAAQAGTCSFTPDVAGQYALTQTITSTMVTDTVTTYSVTNATLTVNASGAALVQAASGLGATTGTQVAGRDAAATFWLPAASTTTSNYTVTATGATITSVLAMANNTDSVSAVTAATTTGITKANGTDYVAGANYVGARTVTSVTASSNATDGITVRFGSATAGAATITVKSVSPTTGVATTVSSVTVTFGAVAAVSPSLSTVFIGQGNARPSTVETTTMRVVKTAGVTLSSATTSGATIAVNVFDTSGTALVNQAVTATITGSGLLTLASGTGTGSTGTVRTASLTATTQASASTAVIGISADGTAGVGTIVITAGGVTIATKTVTFYGAVATLTATQGVGIMRSGRTSASTTSSYVLGGSDATLAAASGISVATATNISIVAKDVDGNVVPLAAAPTAVISDALVIGAVTITDCAGGVALTVCAAGAGNYIASTTSAIGGVSGAKATVTFQTPNPAVAGTFISTAALPFSLGGTTLGGTVTMTLDKATYAPGERIYVTYTAKDSAGNPVRDWTAVAAPSANKSVPGLAGDIFVGGKAGLGDDAGEYVYAPVTPGAFTFVLATGTATGAEITATATVSDDAATAAATAASDAASEATDAANAATDAANAAAEAADAATAAAQDAADAVAALSTAVSAMVSDLKKQITALTNLVIKIQKKVKA